MEAHIINWNTNPKKNRNEANDIYPYIHHFLLCWNAYELDYGGGKSGDEGEI
jgi:hypothetical protein